MFDSSDPRGALQADRRGARSPAADGPFAAPQIFHLTELEPDRSTASGSAIWLIRTANCLLLVTAAADGDVIEPGELVDESILLAPDDIRIEVAAGHQRDVLEAASVVILPPGRVRVRAHSDGMFVLVLSAHEQDWLRQARNNSYYRDTPPVVAAIPPAAAGGPPATRHEIQIHRLDQVTRSPSRFGRIFRSQTLMVNPLYDENGPRDPDRLSPHAHADFEQCSVTFCGDYVHHLRTPWTPKLAEWRDDLHVRCASPSVTIIPPGVTHTTQGVGPGLHKMADIFAPPRADLLAMPGWVLNSRAYPGQP